MKTSLATLFLLVLCYSLQAFAVTLKWDFPNNERLEITRTAQVKFLVNDRAQNVYEERNIINLTCYDSTSEASSVKGRFTVYHRDNGEEVFHQREQYQSEFAIDRLGRFTVPKQYYMPNLRNVPTLPGKDVGRGDKWSADAELILNNFSLPFKLTFPTEYQLTGIEKKKGSEIAVINYAFLIDMNLSGGKYPPDFPLKIMGNNEGTVWWDITQNRPVRMKEKYRIVFFFPTETKKIGTNEFQMLIDTNMKMYKPVTREQKEAEKRALKQEIPDGLTVDSD